MEVAVSFRAEFDDNKDIIAYDLNEMNKVLEEWLQNVIARANVGKLHTKLEKAAGVMIPTVYFWVLSDLYSDRDRERMEEHAQAEAEESVGT